ncbi:MAG: hypothetical protein JOZ77_01585 [Candidatus Eremiobacteraeota bacterium]|nr:hypothetical protein [Candidatus Eremiobacteraeota bacterium]
MRKSVLLVSTFVLGLSLAPTAAPAQTDQTTTAPVATVNPATGATVNPMDNPTAAPVVNNYPAGNGGNGWWGLIGLIGLLGLFGGRNQRTTTISGPP